METIVFSRDTRATISLPTTHPIVAGFTDALSELLSGHPQVSHAYLLQVRYPPGHDPAIGDTPCLTCVLRMDGDSDNQIFNEISRASQRVVDGRLGPWRFLDFARYSESMGRAIESTTTPFYVRR